VYVFVVEIDEIKKEIKRYGDWTFLPDFFQIFVEFLANICKTYFTNTCQDLVFRVISRLFCIAPLLE